MSFKSILAGILLALTLFGGGLAVGWVASEMRYTAREELYQKVLNGEQLLKITIKPIMAATEVVQNITIKPVLDVQDVKINQTIGLSPVVTIPKIKTIPESDTEWVLPPPIR